MHGHNGTGQNIDSRGKIKYSCLRLIIFFKYYWEIEINFIRRCWYTNSLLEWIAWEFLFRYLEIRDRIFRTSFGVIGRN